MKLTVNDNIFFILKQGAIIVWDYKNHTQFELSMEYFQKIIDVSAAVSYNQTEVDNVLSDLIENNIIVQNKQASSNWNFDILSKIFHVGTSDIVQTHNISSSLEFARDYLTYCDSLNIKEKPDIKKRFLNKYKLPLPANIQFKVSDFWTCLNQRKTVRVFKDEVMPLNTLSVLLYLSFGYIHDKENDPNQTFSIGKRKASPSGGNLHPTDVYIITKDILSLENGLYHYDAENHSLDTMQQNMAIDWLPKALLGQYFSENANVHIFLTSKFNLSAWKYPHSRAYRVALLDIGHISQTFQLVSTALGLNTWMTAAFEDTRINAFLNIDGENESVLFYLCSGSSDGQSIPPEFCHAITNF